MKVEELLSKKEVAARLGVSPRTVTELMRSRTISYVKLGRSVRFDWAKVEVDLAKATVKRRAA